MLIYQRVYGIPQFVVSVQEDCTSPTEQVLQRVKLTNSSGIMCHPCLTKHVSISILSIFFMSFATSSHFLVSHARRAVPKVWKPVLLLSMRRRKAEWLHVWWRTDGGLAENLFGSSIFNCMGEKLKEFLTYSDHFDPETGIVRCNT